MYATRHNVNTNIAIAFNKTTQKNIKCSITSNIERNQVEVIMGLEKTSVSMIISCNQPNEAKVDDIITFLGETFIVESIANQIKNIANAKYCTDYSKLPSKNYIALKSIS